MCAVSRIGTVPRNIVRGLDHAAPCLERAGSHILQRLPERGDHRQIAGTLPDGPGEIDVLAQDGLQERKAGNVGAQAAYASGASLVLAVKKLRPLPASMTGTKSSRSRPLSSAIL